MVSNARRALQGAVARLDARLGAVEAQLGAMAARAEGDAGARERRAAETAVAAAAVPSM